MRMSVVLPDPDVPTIMQIVPARTSKADGIHRGSGGLGVVFRNVAKRDLGHAVQAVHARPWLEPR